MRIKQTSLCKAFVFIVALGYTEFVKAQKSIDSSKSILNKVEFFVGPSLYYPIGVSVSTIGGSIINNNAYFQTRSLKNQLGYQIGIGVEKKISSLLSISSKIAWQMNSFQFSTSGNQIDLSVYNSTGQASIINLESADHSIKNDMLILFLTPEFRIKKIKIAVGLFTSKLIKSNTRTKYYLMNSYSKTSFRTDAEYNRYDYGATLSINWSFTIDWVSISLLAGTYQGLMDSQTKYNEVQPSRFRNSSYFFTVGISPHKFNSLVNKLSRVKN